MPIDAPRGPRHRAERPRRAPGTTARHLAPPVHGRALRLGLGAAAVVAIAAVPVATAPHASAATDATWDRLAACVSKGQWTLNAGDGRSGGLGLNATLWRQHGGTSYSRAPYLASREQQLAVGEDLLGSDGWSPWDPCADRLALTETDKGGAPMPIGGDGAAAAAARSAGPAAGTGPAADTGSGTGAGSDDGSGATSAAGSRTGRVHVVAYGDSLARIAQRYDLGWQQVYDANRGVVGVDPDRIVVGQRLVIPAG